MSPLQCQKQIRLQEARRLMLGEALDAASAGFRVGYEDPAYFSREWLCCTNSNGDGFALIFMCEKKENQSKVSSP